MPLTYNHFRCKDEMYLPLFPEENFLERNFEMFF